MDPINGADVPVAFAAGLVSFVSPCVLPLVPGYLSVITGVSVDEIEETDWRSVLVPEPAVHRLVLDRLHPPRADRDRARRARCATTRTC